MYTAKQCLEAVRLEHELIRVPDHSIYKDVNDAIIEHVNKGWLCLNSARYAYITRDLINYYRSLGFRIDKDGIIYWIYES